MKHQYRRPRNGLAVCVRCGTKRRHRKGWQYRFPGAIWTRTNPACDPPSLETRAPEARVSLEHVYSELKHFCGRELDVRAIAFMRTVEEMAEELHGWRRPSESARKREAR